MTVVYPLKTDFGGGEIAPILQGDTTSPEYKRGVQLADNFEITPYGTLEMRNGTRAIHKFDTDPAQVRLFTFRRQSGEENIVAVTTDGVSLYSREGVLNSNANSNLISNPNFESNGAGWFIGGLPPADSEIRYGAQGIEYEQIWVESTDGTPESNAMGGAQFFFPENNADYKTRLRVTPLADGDLQQFFPIPRRVRVQVRIVKDITTDFDTVSVLLDDYTPGQVVNLNLDWTAPADAETSTWQYAIRVETDDFGGATVRYFNVALGEASTIKQPQTIVPVEFPFPVEWDMLSLDSLQTCIDTAESVMYFTIFNGPMYQLSYTESTDTWSFSKFEPTGISTSAGEIPYTCAIHEGRLWLGGTPDQPSTIYASKVWNYNDFTTGGNPEDGLEFTLSNAGGIQWMQSLKNLLIGTDRAEIIARSQGAAITNSDFQFSNEQTWGSANVQPVEVGNLVFYVTKDRGRVRNLYDEGDRFNGYGSEDMTFAIDTLAGEGFREIAFEQAPSYRITVLKSDGSARSCSWFPAREVLAWSQMNTDGFIASITTTNDSFGAATWFAVRRNGSLMLEIKESTSQNGIILDAHATYQFVPDGGLDDDQFYVPGPAPLLERTYATVQQTSTEVTILDDSTVTFDDPDYIVTTGNSELANQLITVGIPYTATCVTLPLEVGTNPQGTAQVQKRRFSDIMLRLNNGGIPQINGVRPPLRAAGNNMDEGVPFIIGDTQLFVAGWNDGIITLVQDLPIPTHITAIFGKAKGNAV